MENEGKSLWNGKEDSAASGLSSWRDGGAIPGMGLEGEGQAWGAQELSFGSRSLESELDVK